MLRRLACISAIGLTGSALFTRSPAAAAEAQPPPFQVWLQTLIAEAKGNGFDAGLVDRALYRLQPLPRVLEADRAQAGPPAGLDAYLSARLTPALVTRGREVILEHDPLLERVERWFGVQRRFIVAIWGAETSYGRYGGDVPVFQALATLAWDPRRANYFRGELFDALRMVQREDIELESMVGSWAGAMGQPQFMPSSYLRYAFDFDGDGRRDIWRSVPDALASIANYLRSFNWRNGTTWGREVLVPPAARTRIVREIGLRPEGCPAERSLTPRRALSDWAALGVTMVDGTPLPRAGIAASLFLNEKDPTFLVYPNYEAILAYNCSNYYALSVGLLADRLRDAGHLVSATASR